MSSNHDSFEWKQARALAWSVLPHECSECFSTFDLEVDHIVALHLGGTHELSNLNILCSECHGKKSRKEHSNYMRERAQKRFKPSNSHPGLIHLDNPC